MTLSVQFLTLISMIGMGSAFAAVFDTYNRFLNRRKRQKWFVIINDILFWCFQAVLIYFILFVVNFGEIRFYLLLALLCGYSIYQALIKKAYLFLLERIILFLIKMGIFFNKCMNILVFKPIKWTILMVSSILLLCFSLVTICLKAVFNLAKTLLKAVLFILGILFTPVFWILRLIYKLVPERVREKINIIFTKNKNQLLKIKKGLGDFITRLTSKSG